MKLLQKVKLENDKFNNFHLYRLLMEASEKKLINIGSFPKGMIIGDVIFRNIGRQWEPLVIEVKVGYLRIVLYREDENGWICPIKTKVVSDILGFVRDLCEILEGREISKNWEQKLIGGLKVQDKGKDFTLLNSIHIDLGWVK